MSDSIKDKLANVTADIDQAQALIDAVRLKYSNEPFIQRHMDIAQVQLDLKRDRVKMMTFIDDHKIE